MWTIIGATILSLVCAPPQLWYHNNYSKTLS